MLIITIDHQSLTIFEWRGRIAFFEQLLIYFLNDFAVIAAVKVWNNHIIY